MREGVEDHGPAVAEHDDGPDVEVLHLGLQEVKPGAEGPDDGELQGSLPSEMVMASDSGDRVWTSSWRAQGN
jgi:hypothetical protein